MLPGLRSGGGEVGMGDSMREKLHESFPSMIV
jgi:hypothetical protein